MQLLLSNARFVKRENAAAYYFRVVQGHVFSPGTTTTRTTTQRHNTNILSWRAAIQDGPF